MAASESVDESDDDLPEVFEPIRENADAFEEVGEREDRVGAIARYFHAVAHGEQPDDYDAELAGMPKLGGSEE